MADRNPFARKKSEPQEASETETNLVPWWHRSIQHPLTEQEFVQQFCIYIFETTADRDLVRERQKVFRFISGILNPELQKEWAEYRKEFADETV